MKSPARLSATVLAFAVLAGVANANPPAPAQTHKAFILGLNEKAGSALLDKDVKTTGVSQPRSLRPVVSRFKGWYIDVTDKAESGALGDVPIARGISLASKPKDSSYWQFVNTADGYLVVAAGGKYKGWVVARDDAAKTRPEGPNLTVTPALVLSKKVTKNSHWDLTLTKKGLVLTAKSGKYKNWYWDFGGGDPSHKEGDREVAINVLLAEKVVAGSYFAVEPKSK